MVAKVINVGNIIIFDPAINKCVHFDLTVKPVVIKRKRNSFHKIVEVYMKQFKINDDYDRNLPSFVDWLFKNEYVPTIHGPPLSKNDSVSGIEIFENGTN